MHLEGRFLDAQDLLVREDLGQLFHAVVTETHDGVEEGRSFDGQLLDRLEVVTVT